MVLGENVKKRWKSLRDTYAKYLKSAKTKTGQAAKKKKWIWAEHMRAFQPFLSFAKTSSNIGFINTSMEYESDEMTLDYDISDICEVGSLSEPEKYRLQTSTPLRDISNNSLIGNTEESRSSKKKANSQPSSSVKEVIEYLKNKNKVEYDEIDCTMLAHAKSIKKFSPKRQSVTKFKIAELIMKQETLHFEEIEASISKSKIQQSTSNIVSTPTYEPEYIDSDEYGEDYQHDIF